RGGIQRYPERHLPRSDPSLEFGRAADAAHEINALVGSRIGNTEQRCQHEILKQAHVERPNRILMVDALRIDRQAFPPPIEKEGKYARAVWNRLVGVLELPECRKPFPKRRRTEAVQILYQAVVRQDPQLVLRK